MKNLGKILFVVFGLALLTYLALPEPPFPNGLWDFQSSMEPADKETPLRRGYYTNLTREQLMDHYSKEFAWGVRLNYPPEEAQTLIRDQTKSSFLQEVVHPMRESLFVNGYQPKPSESPLEVNGVHYNQKVIVKYVGSNIFVRLAIGFASLVLIWFLTSEWAKTLKPLKWISRS